jgi:hypothetical protein
MRTPSFTLIAVSERRSTVAATRGGENMTRRYVLITALAVATVTAVAIADVSPWAQENSAKAALAVPTMPPAGDFVRTIDNPYLPLTPGKVFVYKGMKDGVAAENTVEVTHRTKTILGVQAVVVDDTASVAGEPEERTTDWYAQDKSGNVWYLGEDSFDLVNGQWVRSEGSWEAGVDGAKAGIVMEAHPQVNDTYRQEYYAGHAEDMARVLSLSESVIVPYGSFDSVLETKDWTPLEPNVAEHKYFARGVGEIKSVMVKGGSEEMELVSLARNK